MEEKKSPSTTIKTWEALGFVWSVFFSIAVPTVVCALGGRWLDRRLHTSPLFLLLGLALSLAVAYVLIKRQAKDLSRLTRS